MGSVNFSLLFLLNNNPKKSYKNLLIFKNNFKIKEKSHLVS